MDSVDFYLVALPLIVLLLVVALGLIAWAEEGEAWVSDKRNHGV